MAHAFDTGLALPQRTLLRNGVVSLLAGLLKSNGGYLHAIIPYGGIVRGYTDEVGIDALKAAFNGRAPSVAVVLGDRVSAAHGQGGFKASAQIEVAIYFYANYAGSLTEGRTAIGAAGLASVQVDPGLEVMMEHVEELLVGRRVGAAPTTNPINEVTRSVPSIKHIVPVREEELVTDTTMTLWVQRYSVTLDRTIDPNRGVTQMLEEIRTVLRTTDADVLGLQPDPDAESPDPGSPGAEVLELQTTTANTP